MKTIGIIGSRSRNTENDLIDLYNTFKKYYKNGDIIVSGGCPKGGDRFAEIIARKVGATIIIHHADWDNHGRGAGFMRNSKIAKDSTMLLACVSENRTGGTEDTIKKWKKLNSHTVELMENDILILSPIAGLEKDEIF